MTPGRRLRRLAVVSDIHGNLPALLAVAAAIDAAAVDAVVNLGDLVSGPLWPVETLDRLRDRGWPTLAGNHERQLQADAGRQSASDRHAAVRLAPAQRAWLATLPGCLWLADDVFCCHGTPDSDLHYLLETVTPDLGRNGSPGIRAAAADEVRGRLGALATREAPLLLLCGHSHQPRVLQLGPLLLVNPGSVGLPAYDDRHPHPHHVETGSPHARWALLDRTACGSWRVEQHLTPYDWEAAATQAAWHGRGDWADALRSGRVGRTEQEIDPP